MVILLTAAIPRQWKNELARKLNIATGSNGFCLKTHLKSKLIDAAADGIFFCDSAQGLLYSVS